MLCGGGMSLSGGEEFGGGKLILPSPSRENPDFTVLGQGRAADANQTISWLPPKRHDFCLLWKWIFDRIMIDYIS